MQFWCWHSCCILVALILDASLPFANIIPQCRRSATAVLSQCRRAQCPQYRIVSHCIVSYRIYRTVPIPYRTLSHYSHCTTLLVAPYRVVSHPVVSYRIMDIISYRKHGANEKHVFIWVYILLFYVRLSQGYTLSYFRYFLNYDNF